MREWLVAGALIESEQRLLMVRNVRRGGHVDWSTPGGVIDDSDDSLLAGLTREVHEETGLTVASWEGPLYEVRAVAPDMDWHLRVEVHRALEYTGELRVDDPDGIVDRVAFLAPDECERRFDDMAPWVREPLEEWLAGRWDCEGCRDYRYRVHGTRIGALDVSREHVSRERVERDG